MPTKERRASEKTTEIQAGTFKIPACISRSKYIKDHLEIMQLLLKVKSGESIRVGYSQADGARAYSCSLKFYIKKQKLQENYFVFPMKRPDEDGNYYVYVGKRGE